MMQGPHDDAMPPHPWERRPGEGSVAWAAFLVYRDAGPGRSLTKTCTQLGRARNTVAEHSARWNWNARAVAFDQWIDREATAAAVDVHREARARQARGALALQTLAMRRLDAVDPENMTTSEAIRAWQIGAQEERRALGMSDALEIDHTTTGGLPLGVIPIREVIVYRPAPQDDEAKP